MNCAEAGVDFDAEECCCKRLTFSCPWGGSFPAFAIALEIMPTLSLPVINLLLKMKLKKQGKYHDARHGERKK